MVRIFFKFFIAIIFAYNAIFTINAALTLGIPRDESPSSITQSIPPPTLFLGEEINADLLVQEISYIENNNDELDRMRLVIISENNNDEKISSFLEFAENLFIGNRYSSSYYFYYQVYTIINRQAALLLDNKQISFNYDSLLGLIKLLNSSVLKNHSDEVVVLSREQLKPLYTILPDVKNFVNWNINQRTDLAKELLLMKDIGCEYFRIFKTRDFNNEEFQNICASFSGLLYLYEIANLGEEFPELIREFERMLAQHKEQSDFNLELLYISDMPELEVVPLRASNLMDIEVRVDVKESTREYVMGGGSLSCNITGCPPNREFVRVSPKFYHKLPSSFQGNNFIVGGERIDERDNPTDYMLNFDKNQYPDILGYAENVSSLVFIPNDKFREIIFNFIDISIFSDNINAQEIIGEYRRILQDGGRLHFKTVHGTKEFFKSNFDKLKLVRKNLREVFMKDPKWEKEKDLEWDVNPEICFYHSFIVCKE